MLAWSSVGFDLPCHVSNRCQNTVVVPFNLQCAASSYLDPESSSLTLHDVPCQHTLFKLSDSSCYSCFCPQTKRHTQGCPSCAVNHAAVQRESSHEHKGSFYVLQVAKQFQQKLLSIFNTVICLWKVCIASLFCCQTTSNNFLLIVALLAASDHFLLTFALSW
jgi:hypothetical protein